MLNRFSCLNNQQRLSLTKGLPSPPKWFGGIPLVPSEQDGGQPTTWWSCTLCDFRSPSDCSRKRTKHLQKAHGLQKCPFARQVFAVRAAQASQSVVKQRWEHRIAEFRGNELGSDHMTLKPSLVASLSIRVNLERSRNIQDTAVSGAAGRSQLDMPISVCASRSKVPRIERRKQIWQTCLQVAT